MCVRKKYKYTKEQEELNRVLTLQDKRLNQLLKKADDNRIQREAEIEFYEDILIRRGIDPSDAMKIKDIGPSAKKLMIVPSWDNLCREAEEIVGNNCDITDLFSDEELKQNELYIQKLNGEFNQIYRLDKVEVAISAFAGILAAAVDILLVGIPQRSPDGLKAGPLSDHIRKAFDSVFPEEEMNKLANSAKSKVPFDAQDNRHTEKYVEGLSAYYHRLLELGHDPLLGFVVGVFDIYTGSMTTIDKKGVFVSQKMSNYAKRQASSIFEALSKEVLHLMSDVTTSMGLPAPLMGLFNLFQFGKIGEYEQTVADIVQGMYYEGYDFIHFCSLSIPVMLLEVIVRLAYGLKRLNEGNSIKDSLPLSLNRKKNPKLSTMLFIAHSSATAINLGKVYFTENPLSINYPQWLAFAKYSYTQLKWVMFDKPDMRDAYVSGKLDDDWGVIEKQIDESFETLSEKYYIVFD